MPRLELSGEYHHSREERNDEPDHRTDLPTPLADAFVEVALGESACDACVPSAGPKHTDPSTSKALPLSRVRTGHTRPCGNQASLVT
jgi:hypothetical protein